MSEGSSQLGWIGTYAPVAGIVLLAMALFIMGLSEPQTTGKIVQEDIRLNPVLEKQGNLTISWSQNTPGEEYTLQLSSAPDFSDILVSEATTSASVSVPAQFTQPGTVYYARVGSEDGWSEVHQFIIKLDSCKGVVCDSPPNNQCFESIGYCEEGTCRYIPRQAGISCDDQRSCTANSYCDQGGRCVGQDSCPDICVGDTLRTAGACGLNGACQYIETECEFGCSQGACNVAAPIASRPIAPPPGENPVEEPAEQQAWEGAFFSNTQLEGSPTFTRLSPTINFDWGTSGPDDSLVNTFSTRWSRTILFEQGVYNFTVRADDGVRVFIDGQPITELNHWQNQVARTYSALRPMKAGLHDVVIEYYEDSGSAVLEFSYARVQLNFAPEPNVPTPPATPPPPPANPPPPPPANPPPPPASPPPPPPSSGQSITLNIPLDAQTLEHYGTGGVNYRIENGVKIASLYGILNQDPSHIVEVYDDGRAGDTVIIEVMTKAGPDVINRGDSGCGVGFDLRFPGSDHAIKATANLVATRSKDWTKLTHTITIPPAGSNPPFALDSAQMLAGTGGIKTSYQIGSSPQNTGSTTSRGGQDWSWKTSQAMPQNIRYAFWLHNWFATQQTCEFRDWKITIRRAA